MDQETLNEQVQELVDILEALLEDLPLKAKERLEAVIEELKATTTIENLIKIQDELEFISNMANIDYFTRNELMNVITSLETIINS